MITKKLLTAIALTLAASTAQADFCSDKWPGDYSMQQYCAERENEAADEIVRFLEDNGVDRDRLVREYKEGNVAAKIFGHCLVKWGGDLAMLNYCIKQQTKAAKSLGKM